MPNPIEIHGGNDWDQTVRMVARELHALGNRPLTKDKKAMEASFEVATALGEAGYSRPDVIRYSAEFRAQVLERLADLEEMDEGHVAEVVAFPKAAGGRR